MTMHTSYAEHTLLPEVRQKKPQYQSTIEASTNAPREQPPSPTRRPDEADFTPADTIVLEELYEDINVGKVGSSYHKGGDGSPKVQLLSGLNDPQGEDFQPTVFSGRDFDLRQLKKVDDIQSILLQRYITWAGTVVRHKTDVVFLNHIILYFITSIPSAMYLYYNFHYIHAVSHLLMSIWYASSFIHLLHNHIHNRGVLSKKYALFDLIFPYILEPLMGHTWDSYYYHHVKHHHVEGNGPDDLSSTLRYQRDSLVDFLKYEARFLLLCWVELPLYFARKQKYDLAFRTAFSDLLSYLLMYLMARWQFRPTLFVLILPFCILRLGLMVGNWGQHALIDEEDPSSDLRSSITLIDVPSNRFCFNDGYHTSHHLNPRRHWRDHPLAFLKAKEKYAVEGALVFHNIDYLGITFCLLTKNYARLARQLVPIGPQIGMSQDEVEAMLKTKTKKFTEEDIAVKFRR